MFSIIERRKLNFIIVYDAKYVFIFFLCVWIFYFYFFAVSINVIYHLFFYSLFFPYNLSIVLPTLLLHNSDHTEYDDDDHHHPLQRSHHQHWWLTQKIKPHQSLIIIFYLVSIMPSSEWIKLSLEFPVHPDILPPLYFQCFVQHWYDSHLHVSHCPQFSGMIEIFVFVFESFHSRQIKATKVQGVTEIERKDSRSRDARLRLIMLKILHWILIYRFTFFQMYSWSALYTLSDIFPPFC